MQAACPVCGSSFSENIRDGIQEFYCLKDPTHYKVIQKTAETIWLNGTQVAGLKLAGYVHEDTMRLTGGAGVPLHIHDKRPKKNHTAIFTVLMEK
jgi:hypothetical protein